MTVDPTITDPPGIYTWGWGFRGALGDNDLTDHYSWLPQRVILECVPALLVGIGGALVEDPPTVFTQEPGGGITWADFSIAMDGSDMQCWAWGANTFGHVGSGDTADQPVPIRVVAPAGSGFTYLDQYGAIIALAGGASFALAVVDPGRSGDSANYELHGWGSDSDGQLMGLGDSLTPMVLMTGLGDFNALAAGYGTGYLLDNARALQAWGLDDHGQRCGSTTIAAPADGTVRWDQIWSACTAKHAIGQTQGRAGDGTGFNGRYYAWGRNDDGQLGILDTTDRSSPEWVADENGNRIDPIFLTPTGMEAEGAWGGAGGRFSLFVPGEAHYQLEVGAPGFDSSPNQATAKVGGLPTTGVYSRAPFPLCPEGYDHALARGRQPDNSSRFLWIWGDNAKGQLGIGTLVASHRTAQQVLTPDGKDTLELVADVFAASYQLSMCYGLGRAISTGRGWWQIG